MESYIGFVGRESDGRGTSEKPPKLIGQLLLHEGLITNQQLNQALALQAGNGGRLVHQLIALGHLTAHRFVSFVARQPGVASIDISQCSIGPEVAALVPRDFAFERQVCPIDHLGRLLTVGMVCPLDHATLTDLRLITGLSVKAMLCTADSIVGAIRRCYPDESPFNLTNLTRGDLNRLQWIR